MPKTGATSGSAQATNRLAHTLRRRDIASRLMQATPYCLASGTLLWSAAIGLARWTHSPIPEIELAGLIGSLSLTAAAYIGWSRARSTTSMLLHADSTLGLPSTLTNGSQLQHETGPFAQAAVQASERIARELGHNQLTRIAPIWRFTWWQGSSASISLALACAVAAFLWLWSPNAASPNSLSRDAAQALIDQAQQAISPLSAASAQAQSAAINQDPVAARARAELDAIEMELRQGQTTPQDAALRAARTLETAADEAQNAARSQQQTADNTAESLSRAAAAASRTNSDRGTDPPPQDLTKAIAQADLQRAAALAQDLANRPADLSPSQREQLAAELQAIADALREDAAKPPQDETSPTSPTNAANTQPAAEQAGKNSGNDQKPADTSAPQKSSVQSQPQGQDQNQKQDLARSLERAAESLRNAVNEKNAQDQQHDPSKGSDPSVDSSSHQSTPQTSGQTSRTTTPPSQPSPSTAPKAADPAAPANSTRDRQPNPSPRQNQATDSQSPKDTSDSPSRPPDSEKSAPGQTQSSQTTSSPTKPAQEQSASDKPSTAKSPSEKPDSSSNPSVSSDPAKQATDAAPSEASKQPNQPNQSTQQKSQQRAPQDNQSFGPQTPRSAEQNGDPNGKEREPQSTPNSLSELAQKLRSVERARQNQDSRPQQWREQAQDMLSKADKQPSQNENNALPQSPRPPSDDIASAPPGTSNQSDTSRPNDTRPGGMQPRDPSTSSTSTGTSPLAGTRDPNSTQRTARPGASQTIDFNPSQSNSPAAPNDRVIAELPNSANPSRSANSPAGTTTLRESLANARQGADRAIESQSVPREYQDLVRRVFRRYESRASNASSAPAPSEGKLSPDAAPANPSNSGK
jgi:hypothetical protein